MSSFVAILTNMLSGGQKNRVALSLTVGISVVLLLSSSFWIYSRNSSRIKSHTTTVEDGGEVDARNERESDGNEDPCPALTSEAKTVETVFEAEVVDVDNEDEDEDEDDDDDEGAKLAELKTKYDDAVRMASKLIQGNAYKRAIEKLTEALELAQIVSPSSKDIISLYNNRSAMYLKEGNVALATQDITVLLTLDPKHIKGRVRRAKLLEEQNKLTQSLDDYMIVSVYCRFSSQSCPVEDSKIEALAKQIAQQRTPQLVAALTANGALPSRSHCKNHFDTFPSVHLWRDRFEETENSKSALISQLGRLESFQSSTGTPSDSNIAFPVSREILTATLQMVCYELYAQNAFKSAFKRLNELQKLSDVLAFVKTLSVDASTYPKNDTSIGNHYLLLALQLELLGTEKQLIYSLDAALEAFEWSSKMWALYQESRKELDESCEEDAEVIFHEIDVKLKVAAIYLENRQEEKAHEICSALLESSAPCFHPWVYIHRCTFWLNRNEKYELKAEAIDAGSADIETCLSLTKDTSSSQAELLVNAEWSDLTEDQVDILRNAARFISLLRFIFINTQIKNQAGIVPSESDLARNKTSLAEIKELFPKHEAVLQLEVDALTQEGEPDKAIALLDKFKKGYMQESTGSEMDVLMEVTLILLRASILTAKAFMMMQSQTELMAAQELFPQIEVLYKEALSLDPMAIEVSAQYAQLKSMILADFDGAAALLKAALPIARTRIEVVELCTMLVMNEAQAKAIKEVLQV